MFPRFDAWRKTKVTMDNIVCWFCKKDTKIPCVLHMVIPEGGLKCPHCGSVVAQGSKVWM